MRSLRKTIGRPYMDRSDIKKGCPSRQPYIYKIFKTYFTSSNSASVTFSAPDPVAPLPLACSAPG